MAAPMPRVPPVTNATRPANLSVAGGLAGSGWDSRTSVISHSSSSRVVLGALFLGEMRQRHRGGVGPAHAVCAWSWRRGRGADVHPGHTNSIRRQSDSWSEHQLADVLGPGHDVAADIVRVVAGHLGRAAHRVSDDAVTESGCEAFDLPDNGL